MDGTNAIDWTKQDEEMNDFDRIFCDMLFEDLKKQALQKRFQGKAGQESTNQEVLS